MEITKKQVRNQQSAHTDFVQVDFHFNYSSSTNQRPKPLTTALIPMATIRSATAHCAYMYIAGPLALPTLPAVISPADHADYHLD